MGPQEPSPGGTHFAIRAELHPFASDTYLLVAPRFSADAS
jgi:hypothetical protein